jgi:hypothetical protein
VSRLSLALNRQRFLEKKAAQNNGRFVDVDGGHRRRVWEASREFLNHLHDDAKEESARNLFKYVYNLTHFYLKYKRKKTHISSRIVVRFPGRASLEIRKKSKNGRRTARHQLWNAIKRFYLLFLLFVMLLLMFFRIILFFARFVSESSIFLYSLYFGFTSHSHLMMLFTQKHS